MSFISKTKDFILDILFPWECLGCGKDLEAEAGGLCPQCLKSIPEAEEFHQKPTFLEKIIAASSYNNPLLKKAIHTYKYQFVRNLSKPLSQLLIKKLNQVPSFSISHSSFLIIPVPLHKRRLRWRGFNQAELLAREVSNHFGIPIKTRTLIRKRATSPQAEIKDVQTRQENIKNVFECREAEEIKNKNLSLHSRTLFFRPLHPRGLKNKTVILIDDVATTSATLSECAKVLKKAGAKKIWGLVLARG